jgi:hypothetical protein
VVDEMKCFRGALVASSWSCGLRGWTVGPDGILAKEKELGGSQRRAQAELMDLLFIIYYLLFIIYDL